MHRQGRIILIQSFLHCQDYRDDFGHTHNDKDRRSYWSKLRGSFFSNLPIVRGRVAARAADCSVENSDCSHPGQEYYEDTYNDESWSCTFGTHEEVSNRKFRSGIFARVGC